MIDIKKAVHRRTRGTYSTLYAKPRQVVVSIMPGDVLQFRELGRRTRFIMAIDTAFRHAIHLAALHEAAEKRKKKKGTP